MANSKSLSAVLLIAGCFLVATAAAASASQFPFFGVEFAYSVHVRSAASPALSFDSFAAVSAREQKMKMVTAESGSGDVLWHAEVYDCAAKKGTTPHPHHPPPFVWTAYTNNSLGRCGAMDIASICPIATGPSFWGSFAFLRNVSLLEYDEVQQWMWQGPYSWQKGDFYTRTVAGGRIEPVAIAAVAASATLGKTASSSTTWNYYTSFTNVLPYDAFAVPASCFSSSSSVHGRDRLPSLLPSSLSD